MLENKKIEIKKKIKKLWLIYGGIIIIFLTLGLLFENQSEEIRNVFIILVILTLFPGIIFVLITYSKLKSSISLAMANRDIPLLKKKDIRAICSKEVLLETISSALEDGIEGYVLKYAYEDNLYLIGYENSENFTCYLSWENGVQQFNSISQLKDDLNLNHEVTVLDEFQKNGCSEALTPVACATYLFFDAISLEGTDIVRMNLLDNYIIKKYIVAENSDRYNYNVGEKVRNLQTAKK